jgi:hypothetical protein
LRKKLPLRLNTMAPVIDRLQDYPLLPVLLNSGRRAVQQKFQLLCSSGASR